jgi:hypothetical protein
MNTHTLTRHRDIQDWVSENHGTPAIRREPNRFGEVRARLELIFRAPKARPASGMPRVDDGVSPVSWNAWLAELDRRQLALKVTDAQPGEFELVPRRELN